jgi:hypothetical protein
MTNYTTKTLLDNIVYGTPSGNYDGSSQDFYSDPIPAGNYYSGQGSLQTVTYNISNCSANLTVQATLNDLTEQAKWFDVNSQEFENQTATIPANVLGNFCWLRVRVTIFDQGSMTVSVAY